MAIRGLAYRANGEDAERGAALLEFAVVLSILSLLLLGIVEMSWAFAQQNDIRQGTREGVRMAAVDWGTAAALGQEICDRMDVVHPTQTPTVTFTPISGGGIGGLARITVSAEVQTLTGFLDSTLSGAVLESTIEFRLEQPNTGTAQWWNGGIETVVACV